MSRQHASRYKAPADRYAHARCVHCPHFVDEGHEPGTACQYAADGCRCTNHRLKEVTGDGPDAA